MITSENKSRIEIIIKKRDLKIIIDKKTGNINIKKLYTKVYEEKK